MDVEPNAAGQQPDGWAMSTRDPAARHQTRGAPGRARRLWILVFALSSMAVVNFDIAAAQQPPATVEVQRGGFYDTCFVATAGTVQQKAAMIAVRLAIEHKQSSGLCGCKSAALKVLVFAEAGAKSSSNTPLGGKRLVQTSPAFSNRLPSYDLVIKKRRSEPPRNYKVWLACAS
jgi:hypothetical protein